MDFAQPDLNVASAEKAAAPADGEGKQERAETYSAAETEIINTEVGAVPGYCSSVKKYPAFGFTGPGVRVAVRRLKAGVLKRNEGSGRPLGARTAENASKLEDVIGVDPTSSLPGLAIRTGMSRTEDRNALKRNQGRKSLPS